MQRKFAELESRQFDLLIIGGGIFAACAAWDATLRGLSVALVEQADFGSGTSANSFKVVHGGIRYLQHADLLRLRASCHERSALLRIAPHLVAPVPIAIPTYGRGRQGRAVLGAGMRLYDLFTIDRNRGIEAARRIPRSRFLDRAEITSLFPGVRAAQLTGAGVFHDGQMYNPPRLVLAFLRSAAERGALVVNYAEVQNLNRSGNAVTGARVRDHLDGDSIDVRARVVLNAAGPWAPWLMAQRGGVPLTNAGSYSRDAYFVVPRRFAHSYGLALQGRTHDPDAVFGRAARHLFLLPWRHYTLCGVWHRVCSNPPEAVQVTDEELRAFVDEVNAAMPALSLRREEITTWNAGLVPFGDNEPGADHLRYGKRSHLIDHAADGNLQNLVSLIGVRYTMARGDAAQAVDLLCKKLGEPRPRPPTESTRLSGADFDEFDSLVDSVARAAGRAAAEALAHNYGSRYRDVVAIAERQPEWHGCLSGTTTLKAEVIHAIREEMAVRLADVVHRRTDLASGGSPGHLALEEAATIAGRELRWNAAQRSIELADVLRGLPSGEPAAGGVSV